MLDFFTIFSKSGLVLWCFQGVRGPAAVCTAPVNALIRSVLLQVTPALPAAAATFIQEFRGGGGSVPWPPVEMSPEAASEDEGN